MILFVGVIAMGKVKLCIAGKNNIAVDVLAYVLKHQIYTNDEIVVICNKNDDGKNKWQKSLRFFAHYYNVREVKLEDVYRLPKILFLSLEFDRIIKPLLFQTKYLYNIHFSALPKYKGMYTSALPILNHEKYTGVTFHKIDEGIDTGDIINQVCFPIEFNDTARDLYNKYISYGTKLVVFEISRMKYAGYFGLGVRQNPYESTYYSRKEIDYTLPINVDLQQTALSLHDQLRAFSFREYQLPKIMGESIVFSEITEKRSCNQVGKVLYNNSYYKVISTIDYDVIIYVDKFQCLMNAIAQEDYKMVLRIPHLEQYVNQYNENGMTPLLLAVSLHRWEIVSLLLSFGADVEQVDYNGKNVLAYAMNMGVDDRIRQFIYLLISKGIDKIMYSYNEEQMLIDTDILYRD